MLMAAVRTVGAALLAPLVLVATPARADALVPPLEPDVPFVGTPPEVVRAMLAMADVGPADIVYDLGSGDGRIPIAAVRDFGARTAVGVEIDPELVAESRANAREAGVSQRTRFIQGDLFETDFSEATVVTLYLFPQINQELRPHLLAQLAPGSRVVSHQFDMGQWRPDDRARIEESSIFMWRVPADASGRWRWRLEGTEYRLVLGQQFQRVLGELRADGDAVRITSGTVDGRRLRIETPVPGRPEAGTLTLAGRIEGERIRGAIRLGGRSTEFAATRDD